MVVQLTEEERRALLPGRPEGYGVTLANAFQKLRSAPLVPAIPTANAAKLVLTEEERICLLHEVQHFAGVSSVRGVLTKKISDAFACLRPVWVLTAPEPIPWLTAEELAALGAAVDHAGWHGLWPSQAAAARAAVAKLRAAAPPAEQAAVDRAMGILGALPGEDLVMAAERVVMAAEQDRHRFEAELSVVRGQASAWRQLHEAKESAMDQAREIVGCDPGRSLASLLTEMRGMLGEGNMAALVKDFLGQGERLAEEVDRLRSQRDASDHVLGFAQRAIMRAHGRLSDEAARRFVGDTPRDAPGSRPAKWILSAAEAVADARGILGEAMGGCPARREPELPAGSSPGVRLRALSEDPPVALLTLPPGGVLGEETHEVGEIALVRSGSAAIQMTRGTKYQLVTGSALEIGAHNAHTITAGSDGAELVLVKRPAAGADLQREPEVSADALAGIGRLDAPHAPTSPTTGDTDRPPDSGVEPHVTAWTATMGDLDDVSSRIAVRAATLRALGDVENGAALECLAGMLVSLTLGHLPAPRQTPPEQTVRRVGEAELARMRRDVRAGS